MTLLSFDYGQRHCVELDYAAAIATTLDCPHEIVNLAELGRLLTGSALTDVDVAVPDGYYTDESMRATVVPNRNAIMLDIAVAIAVTREADAVAFGAHAGDHAIYPDCRPEFVERFAVAARTANEGLLTTGFEVLAPFPTLSKADIVCLGVELEVPFERTWSCYRGGTVHCGTCGTCTERREAFARKDFPDPTIEQALHLGTGAYECHPCSGQPAVHLVEAAPRSDGGEGGGDAAVVGGGVVDVVARHRCHTHHAGEFDEQVVVFVVVGLAVVDEFDGDVVPAEPVDQAAQCFGMAGAVEEAEVGVDVQLRVRRSFPVTAGVGAAAAEKVLGDAGVAVAFTRPRGGV